MATTNAGSRTWSELVAEASPQVNPGASGFPAVTCADEPETIPHIFREPRHQGASGGAPLHMIEMTGTAYPLVSDGLGWCG